VLKQLRCADIRTLLSHEGRGNVTFTSIHGNTFLYEGDVAPTNRAPNDNPISARLLGDISKRRKKKEERKKNAA